MTVFYKMDSQMQLVMFGKHVAEVVALTAVQALGRVWGRKASVYRAATVPATSRPGRSPGVPLRRDEGVLLASRRPPSTHGGPPIVAAPRTRSGQVNR